MAVKLQTLEEVVAQGDNVGTQVTETTVGRGIIQGRDTSKSRDMANGIGQTLSSYLAPILGAGAVGVCPICWIGSASLLTYLGLGALVPVWQWVVLALLVIGIVGFIFDYRFHRNLFPLAFLINGGLLLYIGRYVFTGPGLGYWPRWGPGSIAIVIAVFHNKKQFTKNRHQHLR